jgi:ubiquitin thioesterase OTU1
MNFRVKGPQKTATFRSLPNTTTLGEFKALIAKECGVPVGDQTLTFGMPTQTITSEDSALVSSILKTGESITLEVTKPVQTTIQSPKSQPSPNQSSNQGPHSVSMIEGDGAIIKRVVPDDNSCMFHAISLCFEHSKPGKVEDLRNLIAKVILSDPINYNEATLQKSPEEYAKFMKQTNSWGGSVELSIFSEHYKAEIIVFDIARQRHNCFGEERNYQKRIYLVYDGIHYDALVWNLAPEANNKDWDITIFNPNDYKIESACQALIQKEFKSGKFVDEYNYKIKCGECGQVFVGNKNAIAHSSATGHTSFTQT